MEQKTCPICGKKDGCKQEIVQGGFVFVNCNHFKYQCFIDEDLLALKDGDEKKERTLDLITELLIRNPSCMKTGYALKWGFYYNPDYKAKDTDDPQMINMAERIGSYPETVTDLADRALMNLAIRFPQYGEVIDPLYEERRVVFDHHGADERCESVHEILEEMGLLRAIHYLHYNNYKITAKGWERISQLQHKENEIRQGFIAMSFREETRSIREAFRQAITEAGYAVRIIDEKEHNNQIVPEIFYEIQRSKFVVVDVTVPNYGAYYEAGYAQALGKQVIICCREAEFHEKDKRPHFDIAQKSMIVWEKEEDLVAKLKRRIEATVG